jgi:hypothetical protein
MRFREEYKRYYFRDIQAIVIGDGRSFHISTRASLIGYFWLLAFIASYRFPQGPWFMSGIGIMLAVAWVYISATCSCTCRVHTSVSNDRLPSVYRTWTARKFLRIVETEISRVQGVLDQPLTDPDATDIGTPRTSRFGLSPDAPIQSPSPGASRPSSPSFLLLLAGLFADGVWHWFNLQHPLRWASFGSTVLGLLDIALAIFVMVRYRQQRVRPAQHRLAVATLVGSGLVFYGTMVGIASYASFRAASTRTPVDTQPALHVMEKINIGVTLALGIVGVGILLLDKPPEPESGGIV